jgi:hypothetical protein
MNYYKFIFIMSPEMSVDVVEAAHSLYITKSDFVRECISYVVNQLKETPNNEGFSFSTLVGPESGGKNQRTR